MTKYREILRLLNNKLKTDEIVQVFQVSNKTVIKVKKRASELGISWPLSSDMTDEKLETITFPKPSKSVVSDDQFTRNIHGSIIRAGIVVSSPRTVMSTYPER